MLNKAYLFADVDEEKMAVPSKNSGFNLNSHGDDLYGRVLLPALETEEERAPVLVMLHGYPGREQNLDIPPAMRRAGIATAHFSYRGVWGSHGYYRFSHLIEDTFAVVDMLRQRAEQYRIDPERIYLLGHSMGGFTALNAIADGLKVRGAVIVAPCDMAMRCQEELTSYEKMKKTAQSGVFNLPDGKYLWEDLELNCGKWRFDALADRLPPEVGLHFIGGTRDTAVPPPKHIFPLYERLLDRGMDVSYQELNTGHAFTGYRITLTGMVYDLIEKMERDR